MNTQATYPALDADLETSLREDASGAFLAEFQRSLRAYVDAVEVHLRSGLSMEHYQKWQDLQKAAVMSSALAEEIHMRMRAMA